MSDNDFEQPRVKEPVDDPAVDPEEASTEQSLVGPSDDAAAADPPMKTPKEPGGDVLTMGGPRGTDPDH
jgi:hypothetical protein